MGFICFYGQFLDFFSNLLRLSIKPPLHYLGLLICLVAQNGVAFPLLLTRSLLQLRQVC